MKHKDLKIIFSSVMTLELEKDIESLTKRCQTAQEIAFKFELEYKLLDAANKASSQSSERNNEFLAYLGDELIAYAGICQFTPFQMEVSGMVDPRFRNQGCFTKLMDLVFEEAKIRNAHLLLLCDTRSVEGKQWISHRHFRLDHIEHEMQLPLSEIQNRIPIQTELVEASNSDIPVIRELNNEFHFGEEMDIVPEEEAKRGIQIYLGKYQGEIVSKIHVSRQEEKAWIYGFIVRPTSRGFGIGKQVLIQTLDKYSSLGVKTMYLQVDSDNPTAKSLYERVGFQPIYSMEYHQWIQDEVTEEGVSLD